VATKETERWPTAFGRSRCQTLCALLLAAGNTSAEYRFDVWTADSGLPQNSVRAIVQSRDGGLWVGTLNGLARFDGGRLNCLENSEALCCD